MVTDSSAYSNRCVSVHVAQVVGPTSQHKHFHLHRESRLG